MRRSRSPGPLNIKRTWSPDYGDGSDGSPASSTFTVAKQEYQWVDYTLDNGNTITLAAAYKPTILRCQGTLTINGVIDGDGLGYPYHNFGTDDGKSFYITGRAGQGPGAGTTCYETSGGSGAGASHGTTGTAGAPAGRSVGGSLYSGIGALLTQTWLADCAGSSGASGAAFGSEAGAASGAGGAGLVLVARRIVLGTTASITLDGANGTNAAAGGGGGGGGSGGFLALIANAIELASSGTLITATGGTGGTGGTYNGGAGGSGRVYLCYFASLSPSDATSRSNPTAATIILRPTMNTA